MSAFVLAPGLLIRLDLFRGNYILLLPSRVKQFTRLRLDCSPLDFTLSYDKPVRLSYIVNESSTRNTLVEILSFSATFFRQKNPLDFSYIARRQIRSSQQHCHIGTSHEMHSFSATQSRRHCYVGNITNSSDSAPADYITHHADAIAQTVSVSERKQIHPGLTIRHGDASRGREERLIIDRRHRHGERSRDDLPADRNPFNHLTASP